VAGNEKTSKSELAGMKHAVDASGRVLRDNVWGPQEEDAVRRDFTINAMYYDPRRRWWWTTTAASDVKKRVLRMIGDPATALPRRPGAHHPRVRFCRQAQLGFTLEKKTARRWWR
jgi:poly(A) polymerase